MSEIIKKINHGGRRPGAGRKPNAVKALMRVQAGSVNPVTAAAILGNQDEFKLWERHLHSRNEHVALDALKYLTDRRDGKAKQAIEHMGPDGGPLQAAVLVKFVGPEGE